MDVKAALMAQFVGTISKLSGAVSARAADAGTRMLELGDDVCEGEVLVTSDEALVEVMFQDAPPIVLTDRKSVV